MSLKNIVKTTVAVSLFAFVFVSVALTANAQTYTNTSDQPAYTSYGTFLPSGTDYTINGVEYTANGSTYIPTGTPYTVNGVNYIGGVIGVQTTSTATGAGNYTYLPAGTVYTVNGTAYANPNGTYIPNGSMYTANGTTYIANGGTYYVGMPGANTTPTFPNTGLGGNASVNWSILALGLLGAAGVMYFTRRNAVLAR